LIWFEVTAANPVAAFEVNALASTERVYTQPVPEVSTIFAGALALGCLFLRRRQ